jgi:hypothetical protein
MLLEDANNQDYAAENLRLKAVNDQFRERGKQWLWNSLEMLCAELNRQLQTKLDGHLLQTGRQEWQFMIPTSIGEATMVGERFGVRYRGQTLVVEAGWPQQPEHGFVPDGGLARGRVRFSPNVMLEPLTKAELVLKRNGADVAWHTLNYKKLSEPVTTAHLRAYLDLLLKD